MFSKSSYLDEIKLYNNMIRREVLNLSFTEEQLSD